MIFCPRQEAIDGANLTVKSIDKVFLVGGTSRVPLVQAMITRVSLSSHARPCVTASPRAMEEGRNPPAAPTLATQAAPGHVLPRKACTAAWPWRSFSTASQAT